MVYGYFITDAVGNEHFFIEGCSYCRVSTGGQHEANCPNKDLKVAVRPNSYIRVNPEVRISKYDDESNFIKEIR